MRTKMTAVALGIVVAVVFLLVAKDPMTPQAWALLAIAGICAVLAAAWRNNNV